MEDVLRTLRRKRIGMLLLNLLYFAGLFTIGAAVFRFHMGGPLYLFIAVWLVAYLLLVRPVTKKYVQMVRSAILRNTIGHEMTEYYYSEKNGVSAQQVQQSGLILSSSPKTFLSREYLSGRIGRLNVEMADVTFPIRENNLNAMFSGAYLHVEWPGPELPKLEVRGGDISQLQLPKKQAVLLEKACSVIPGSLYLRIGERQADLLLRGRFLGFRINPLIRIVIRTLEVSPLPEIDAVIQFLQISVGECKHLCEA